MPKFVTPLVFPDDTEQSTAATGGGGALLLPIQYINGDATLDTSKRLILLDLAPQGHGDPPYEILLPPAAANDGLFYLLHCHEGVDPGVGVLVPDGSDTIDGASGNFTLNLYQYDGYWYWFVADGPNANWVSLSVEKAIPSFVARTAGPDQAWSNINFFPYDTYVNSDRVVTSLEPGLVRLEFPVDVGGAFSASQLVWQRVVNRTGLLPTDLAGSKAYLGVAPTADTVFDLLKNGTMVAQVEFLATQLTGSFINASSGVPLAVDDVLTVVAPASPDATAAHLSLLLVGTYSSL